MIPDFEQWWAEMSSNVLWWQKMQEQYARKNLKAIKKETYLFLLGKNRFDNIDYTDYRTCFFNFCKNAKDEVTPVALQQEEQEKDKKKNDPPVTGARRQERIKELLDAIKSVQTQNAFPPLTKNQILEEGGWIPKKQAPYPSTNEAEVIKSYLHDQWIRENFEPRTGDKLPNFKEEKDWLLENGY